MAPPRHPLRKYIVSLFRHGDLVSVYEGAQICGASRQVLTRWLKMEGINIDAHRMARIAAYRTSAQRYLDGLPPQRKPTKAQLRKFAERALKQWNKANAKRAQAHAGKSGAKGNSREGEIETPRCPAVDDRLLEL
jgi:hypothetical protein